MFMARRRFQRPVIYLSVKECVKNLYNKILFKEEEKPSLRDAIELQAIILEKIIRDEIPPELQNCESEDESLHNSYSADDQEALVYFYSEVVTQDFMAATYKYYFDLVNKPNKMNFIYQTFFKIMKNAAHFYLQ